MNKKLVPIVGILLILGVGVYMFAQKKSGPPVSPEVRKAQEEMLANCKYDADFCKYVASGLTAMSGGYTMTSESTYDGKKSKMILKSDGKDNSESISYVDGKEESRFISLNKTTYMKEPGASVWTEFPPMKDETGKPSTNLFDFEGLKKDLTAQEGEMDTNDTLKVKKIGSEKCGSHTCTLFEMTDTNTPEYTTKIWVDTTDYYARKMESSSKEGVSMMTFEYGPITITKPSPVKQMPAFDSSIIQKETNIDMGEIQKMMKDLPMNSEGSEPVEEMPTE